MAERALLVLHDIGSFNGMSINVLREPTTDSTSDVRPLRSRVVKIPLWHSHILWMALVRLEIVSIWRLKISCPDMDLFVTFNRFSVALFIAGTTFTAG